MNDLVLWLDATAHDRPGQGRRQERLARRDDRQARQARRVACPAASPPRRRRSATSWRTSGLAERIRDRLATLDVDDVDALAAAGARSAAGSSTPPLPAALEQADPRGLREAVRGRRRDDIAVAVRSSATAEDLPDASFAGQQETFLNVRRHRRRAAQACKEVFASLYNDRAIAYRVHQGFAHDDVCAVGRRAAHGAPRPRRRRRACSRSTPSRASATWCSSPSSYGLGETVVQGAVNPDEFYVYKPTLRAGKPAILRRNLGAKAHARWCIADAAAGERVQDRRRAAAELRNRFSLTDADVAGARAARRSIIEEHYGRPMDIEWGKDGVDRQALHPAGAPGDGEVARRTATPIERYTLKGTRQGAGRRPRDRPEDRRRHRRA